MSGFFVTILCLISEKDLQWMVKELRGPTKDTMKIEVAKWTKHLTYQMHIQKDLKTKLIIEKAKHCYLIHPIVKYDYREIFYAGITLSEKVFTAIFSFLFNTYKNRQTILIRGNPGVGKSTLLKKVAWHWAAENFRSFRVVLFATLKLLCSNDTIEDIMIQQNDILRDEITPEKLRSILEKFGTRCLLIFDDF